MSFCELFFVFILIYSDVSSAQNGKPAARGSCGQPQPVANAVLRPPFRNKETFNASEVVEYDCAIGYSITGRSRERTCDNGRWSSIKFSCDLITCPYVPPPEHGRRLDWNNGAGEYTEFGCNTGYEMKGPKKILCRTDGKWRPTRPPTCEPILCPELFNVRNGKGLFQDTSGGIRNDYESVTEYTCKRGYYLNRDTKMKVYKRTCQADGTWDGERPTCDIPRCKQIPDFHNGTIRYFGDRKLYSQAFYRCVDAFSLFPKDVDMSECEDTLKWKPDPPKCYRNVEKKIPANGYGIPGGHRILLHTESYKVCCNKDYELKTDSKIGGKCMKERIQNYKGKLVPNVPECIEERCDPADLKYAVVKYKNGEMLKTKIPSRTKVDLSCTAGYDYYSNGLPMKKPVERECIKGKIKNAPHCEKKKCLLSGYPNNTNTFYKIGNRVVFAGQYINHGRKVRVNCRNENEYELFVNSTQTYLEKEFSTICRHGQFDKRKNDFPICLEKRCDVADLKDAVVEYKNGITVKTKIPSRTKVYLSCRYGYDYYNSNRQPMKKPLERECIKGKIKNAPQCQKKKCLLSGYPTNTNTFYKIGHRVVSTDEYIDHGSEVRVYCRKESEYELFVNSTQTYLEEKFSTECRHGQFDKRKNDFPICLEKRCSFDGSNDGVCLSTDGEDVCKRNKFKINSGSTVQLTCENGYKLYRSIDRRSVEETEDKTLLRCSKGKYPLGYRCISDGFLNTLKHLANKSAKTIYRLTCRFSIFGFETCKDPCLIPEVMFGYAKHNMDKIEDEAEHRTTISVGCNDGYTPSEQMTTTCKNGEWDHQPFPKCNPNPCNLTFHEGISFWASSRLLTVGSGTKQTFDNGTKLKIQCDKGYKMKDMISKTPVKQMIKYSTCEIGKWTHQYECIPEKCSVPNVSHASLEGKAASPYKHREKITLICADGFNFDQNVSTKVTRFETTCNLGNWTDDIPQECKEDGCRLDMHEGSNYYVAITNESITSVKLIEHLVEIQLQCMNAYDLFNDKNEIFMDKNYKPTVTCYRGKWKNAHFCKKRCVLYNITNGRFMKDTVNLTDGVTIKHGESVKVECDDGNYDSNLSIECNSGTLHPEIDCSVERSSSASTKSTETTAEIAADSPTKSDYGYDSSESQKAESVHVDSQSQSKNDKGCTLSKDRRYMYEDRDGKKIKPGSIINDGTTLNVTCSIIDLEEYYISYVYDDENNTDLASYPTITCANITLSQIELDCPVDEAETCQELKHGNVTKINGHYMVSCDKGFSLNLTIHEHPKCTCKNGTLKSVYGDQIPHCIPDNCTIPYEFDGRLSVTYRNSVSLSGGSVVAVREFVYFNCSKADGPNYEPFNRRFTCSNGLWTEAESDGNWKLGYNGKFPECRAAKCEPNCINGGVCNKDDTCQCRHLTEGKRCENVICNEKCNVNGGKCIGPGKCQCPQGKSGKNCEQDGCLLPKDAAKYKDSRTVFSPGENLTTFTCPAGSILSSRDGMTCQDGVWSNIVKCVEAAVYLISVKTGNKWYSGTNAKVYITLHGLKGSTDRIYLQGSFEANDLDETRVPKAKDVRPITSVVIGHDGSGNGPNWYLEYVSIYVENMEEYYVFRHNDWVVEETDIGLPRQALGNDQQRCIDSFDSGHLWNPRWKSIRRKDTRYLEDSRGKSLRGCKQACINLQTMACVAVFYNNLHKTCWGLAVSDIWYFNEIKGKWNSPVYLRTCKRFD